MASADRYLEPYDEAKHLTIIQAASLSGWEMERAGGRLLMGYGNTKHGFGPVCVVDLVETPYVAEPHVSWFPWVDEKEILRAFKWAMSHFGKDREVLLMVSKKNTGLFEHFSNENKPGHILKKRGMIPHMPEIEEIHIYQYERVRA